MTKSCPPFGRAFRPVPKSGVRVAVGREPDIWEFAKSRHCPIMVLPVGQSDTVQSLIKVTRNDNGFDYEELRKVRFVPLLEGLGKE